MGGVVGFGAYAITHRDNFSWGEAALWTAGGAVVGATFGAGAQWVAGALGTAEAATTAATAACADGDCTNEVRIGQQLVNQLQAQLQAQGSSFSPDKLVNLAKFQDRIVFLETGGPKAGLQHILERHAADFMNRGISADQIPNAIMTAIKEGTLVQQVGDAYQFQVIFNGVQQNIQIVIASNGYVVTAHPW